MILIRFSFGAKTSRYGPHELGYRRATRAKQSDAIPSRSLAQHRFPQSDCDAGSYFIKKKGNKVELIMKYSYLY